jgi:hypothetical protein
MPPGQACSVVAAGPMMLYMVIGGEPGLNFVEALAKEAVGSHAAPAGPDGGHYPYARQVRTGWHRDAAGTWAYDGVDDHLWEVFCQQCGDTDGPAESQDPAVRQLRGPYRHKHTAEHVATEHFKTFRAS